MEEEEVEDREGEGGKDKFPTAAAFLSRTEVQKLLVTLCARGLQM